MIIFGFIALGILVFVHELGHFLVAKWCGVGVLEFALGFGKTVFQKQIGDTMYSLRLIPLGGYVRMVGDDPSLYCPEDEQGKLGNDLLEGKSDAISAQEKKMLANPDLWLLNKGYWQKFSIVFAGPLFNILFALLLSFVLHLSYGKPHSESFGAEARIGGVASGFPAEKAGIKPKDLVLSIDGKPVSNWMELATTIATSEGRLLTLRIQREGADPATFDVAVQGTFETEELTVLDEKKDKVRRAMIGITPHFQRIPISILEAAELAPQHVWFITEMTVKGLYAMASGSISTKHIAGPIFILGEAAKSAEQGMDSLWTFMILLSVSLAIFNLLPIPVLDGGHILFFTIAALRGEPVSIKLQRIASQVGMALLLCLMVFAFSNDLIRTFTK
jgi:regulator of sigma E protease